MESRGKARLLVIDDEPAIARYIARALKHDCDVTTVNSGGDALSKLDAGESFDVVLCDVMMPEMNGIELYGILRERYVDLVPRVVFMTGGVFTLDAARFLEGLPNPPIEKPVDKEKLRAMVQSVR